jgi:hypothetical protein
MAFPGDTNARRQLILVYTLSLVSCQSSTPGGIISAMTRRFVLFPAAVLLLTGSLLASEVTGIWAGQQQGRRGEPEDVAFRFKLDGQTLAGKMLGDEFDIPVTDGVLNGEDVRFTIITTNYYSKTKSTFVYTGKVRGREMELERERIQTPEEKAANRPVFKQTMTLKRID